MRNDLTYVSDDLYRIIIFAKIHENFGLIMCIKLTLPRLTASQELYLSLGGLSKQNCFLKSMLSSGQL